MVFARLSLTEYTNRVLNVIKAKFGLHDKSEALNKFAELFGEELVDKEAKEKEIKELIKTCNNHFKKYSHRKMSMRELDKLCGI
jgi:oligoendopeptidase F